MEIQSQLQLCQTKLSGLKSRALFADSKRSRYESDALLLRNKMDKLATISSEIELSQSYYKRAVDLLYARSIGELESLLNNSLSFVFFDKPYRVRLDLDFTRGKKSVSIVLLDSTNPEDPIEIDVKDGVGNGIRTVVSFILQAYYILSKKAYPILLLDESYSYLSAQYVPKFFELVNGFCEQKNLSVVLVTHDVRFLDFSTKRYSVADGVVTEV